MPRSPTLLLLQLPHTRTTDCGGWQRELPSGCRGRQMLAKESYRESRGRKPQCSQVAEHRGDAVPTMWPCILDDNVQHERNIYQLCWTILRTALCSSRTY